MKLILASASPRRKELLTQLLLDLKLTPEFEIQAADIDESPLPDELPVAYVERLAHAKAEKIVNDKRAARERPLPTSKSIQILAADTIVCLGHKLFGKPKDDQDAENMLKELSGKTHQVITGFCFLKPSSPAIISHDITEITFRTLSPLEITNYIATGEPHDKAGAYAIQGGAKDFVKKISGSWSNVVGLPLEKLGAFLKNFSQDTQ